mmetsp:Transcript_8053/g.14920  ORF Transcript_8053/g.14920 Transcript_8053/m.14920 type:complete len:597 (-) Transcript_8053:378-2168(-)|eukprot:CAMPEP_0197522670 /NCGR_PEP_ID=MMETSP1318-20131121/7769_1 /TAXON_ID=552666 /ORGANISM="Partenskyella glossopodia, Strain RCC365" /LENGTH=596 /DNA_ID=CAMNT_0043075113 /DNA_START=219 /DNA_END=2009 /DNA_ORIENTATION=+
MSSSSSKGASTSTSLKGYAALEAKFRKCHTYSVNIGLHLITTPLGLAGFLGLLNLVDGAIPLLVSAVYIGSLYKILPKSTYFKTTVASILILLSVVVVQPTLLISLLGIAASYVFQELAHIITGEITYQSQYMGDSDWMSQLLEHTYYLLPLVLDAVDYMHFSLLGFCVAHNRVLYTKLDSAQQKKDLKTLEKWVLDNEPSTDHTTHWWYDKLEGAPRDAFYRIANCDNLIGMFKESFGEKAYDVDIIDAMNEIYVASPKYGFNSDGVFYMKHVDGPYGIFPFCSTYRTMVAVNFNQQIKTSFPMVPAAYTLSEGDAVGFDFNREVHVISDNKEKNTDFRICLKIHYCMYPKVLRPWGKLLKRLTTQYNTNARALFLATITPGSFRAKASAFLVLATTWLTEITETYMGLNNLFYVLCLGLANYLIHPLIFLIGTSYLHYIIYLGTFYSRRDIAFGTFKRDVMFFKSIALTHLAYYYYKNFEVDVVSLVLLCVGYYIAIAATKALGIDKTYFGSELGHCMPCYVTEFPYNCIPHPMIVGACIGLLGFHKLQGLREEMPYLVPGHISLYLLHCAQEICDFHRNRNGVVGSGSSKKSK